MAYDSFRGVTILFGGLDTNNAILNDTWQFDAHGWKQLTPAHAPGARYAHSLSYDASRHTIVLFGGRDGGTAFNDTWEWNGTDWAPISILGNSPDPRYWHGQTFDPTRGVHVLFGGVGAQEFGDTWEYDGNARTWTLRTTSGPSPRQGIQLAFDAFRSGTILFGGYTQAGATLPDRYLNDTWLWDGQVGLWGRQNPVNIPQGRAFYSLAADTTRAVLLMQNGEVAVNATTPGEVSHSWEWNGLDWSDASGVYDFCCPGMKGAMVYELAHNRMIQFGGFSAFRAGTWSLESVWTQSAAVQVDPTTQPGQFPDVYQTVRQGLAAGPDCVRVAIRDRDYNETSFGFNPLVITKPARLDAYQLSGDGTTVRIH
jgi:hypothetical protein